MLKKVSIHNFRCYINFEIAFTHSLNLLLGVNGSGKSTLFDLLRKMRAFVYSGDKIGQLFKAEERTRWLKSPLQTFSLEIEGNGGNYRYEFSVQHDLARHTAHLEYERLWFDNQPLLKFEVDAENSAEVQLYRDDHTPGPKYPFDWTQSAIHSLTPRTDNSKLIWFRERMGRVIIVRANPLNMSSESEQESKELSADMENFVSWYRYIYQDQGMAFEITRVLQEMIDGFSNFKFVEAGERHRVLQVGFSENGKRRNITHYRFGELSDGQRSLIALYTLIEFADTGAYTLCIDEPENYIALPELQPWLTALFDYCGENDLQALLISHHPELIDYLASTRGLWFSRETNERVSVKPITEQVDGGMPISELIARGWIDE